MKTRKMRHQIKASVVGYIKDDIALYKDAVAWINAKEAKAAFDAKTGQNPFNGIMIQR